jgi:hypothetical protein
MLAGLGAANSIKDSFSVQWINADSEVLNSHPDLIRSLRWVLITRSRSRSSTALIASMPFGIRFITTCCICTRSAITEGRFAGGSGHDRAASDRVRHALSHHRGVMTGGRAGSDRSRLSAKFSLKTPVVASRVLTCSVTTLLRRLIFLR